MLILCLLLCCAGHAASSRKHNAPGLVSIVVKEATERPVKVWGSADTIGGEVDQFVLAAAGCVQQLNELYRLSSRKCISTYSTC